MIEQLFTAYWSQMTLILLAFAYFIKRIFDNKSKKIEINHSLFQQYRLRVTNDFFVNYAKAELMWEHLAIYDILSNKLNAKEIDSIVWPILNELKKNQIELQIYFNDNDMMHFNNLVDGIFSINKLLGELYFDFDKDKTLTNKSGIYSLFKLQVLEKNNQIINQLSKSIKNTYKT